MEMEIIGLKWQSHKLIAKSQFLQALQKILDKESPKQYIAD